MASDPGDKGGRSPVAHLTTIPLDEPASPALAAREAPPANALAPGAVVAGRYRVVRFIAEGGMGEVYEVDDQELGERVALKTIRAAISHNERTIQRFKREIQLARRVTHPNVCRIFELGFHRPPEGPAIPFLVMELLAGETLLARIKRAGPMDVAEARPIVEHMVAALAAAHTAGVIHRDFTSQNVMLVPRGPGEEGTVRAVITDFGLARDTAGDAGVSTGSIAGSPAYMAPEHIEGAEVTAAGDQYALGVVLFEMVSGRLPFVGATPLATALKRLREVVPSPRALAPSLDPRWDAVIMRCLARDPAARFPSVVEVGRALGEDVPADAGAPAAPVEAGAPPAGARARRLPRLAVAVAVALALAGAAAVWIARRPAGAPAAAGARPSVAVFPPAPRRPAAGDATAPDAWVGDALAETLTAELATGPSLRVIRPEALARARFNLALPAAGVLDRGALARVRADLGVEWVVTGSYAMENGRLEVTLTVRRAADGATRTTITDWANEGEVVTVAERLAERVRRELGAPAVPLQGARNALPRDPEAARLYLAGLARLAVYDFAGARGLLEDAVARAPEFAHAHAALATTLAGLFHTDRARAVAKRAFELSGGLPEADRRRVEEVYRRIEGEHQKAADLLEPLYAADPGDLDVGLRLAENHQWAHNVNRAREILTALRALPPPQGDDPRIDLVEAISSSRRHDLAVAAADKARARGARIALAEALRFQGQAAWHAGDTDEAASALEEARAIFEQMGARTQVGRVLNYLGDVAWRRGKLTEATRLHRESIAIFRSTDSRWWVRNGLATLAYVSLDAGEPEEALRFADEAHAIEVAMRREDEDGIQWWIRVRILVARGELAAARALVKDRRDRMAPSAGWGDTLDKGEAFILLAEGESARALALAEEALERLPEGHESASTFLAVVAEVHLLEGRSAEAVAAARRVAQAHERSGALDDQALAELTLARGLLLQGEREEAGRLVEHAGARAAVSENRRLRIEAAVARARWKPPTVAVARSLDPAVAEAEAAGLAVVALDTRLARAEIEVAAGAAGGRAHLREVARDARAKGLVGLARRAEGPRPRGPGAELDQ